MKRLAIVTTHPIQYYAPVFKELAASKAISVKVFYTWGKDSIKKYDPGFKKVVEWDIPLLVGYDYEFLENISKIPGTGKFQGIINPAIIKKINHFNPDVVLIYGWSWNSHLKVIRHFKNKVQVWFRGDSNLLDKQKGVKRIVKRYFLKWVYQHMHKALYVGSANRSYFLEYGFKENQLKFVPHGIDNYRFEMDCSNEAGLIRKLVNIPSEAILLLFAGKFELKKDPLILLNAFDKLNNSNCYLLFVGNGVLEEKLKLAAKQSRLSSRIFFMDFQNQKRMPALYQACDLFCLPSKGPGETWGLAVNEAMAAGRPVLVSDKVGCGADLVSNGRNGYIFKSGNVDDLACKLKLLMNKDKMKEMGEQSKELIKEWSCHKQVDVICQELETL